MGFNVGGLEPKRVHEIFGMEQYENYFEKPEDKSKNKFNLNKIKGRFDLKKAKSEVEEIKERLFQRGILKPKEEAEVAASGSQPQMSGFQKWQLENQQKSALFWKKPKMIKSVEKNVASKNVRRFLSLLDQEDARTDAQIRVNFDELHPLSKQTGLMVKNMSWPKAGLPLHNCPAKDDNGNSADHTNNMELVDGSNDFLNRSSSSDESEHTFDETLDISQGEKSDLVVKTVTSDQKEMSNNSNDESEFQIDEKLIKSQGGKSDMVNIVTSTPKEKSSCSSEFDLSISDLGDYPEFSEKTNSDQIDENTKELSDAEPESKDCVGKGTSTFSDFCAEDFDFEEFDNDSYTEKNNQTPELPKSPPRKMPKVSQEKPVPEKLFKVSCS